MCFNVNFRLLKTIYVNSLVCYFNKLQNARCSDKDRFMMFENGALIGLFRVKVQKVIGESSPNSKLLKLKWRSTQNFSQKT